MLRSTRIAHKSKSRSTSEKPIEEGRTTSRSRFLEQRCGELQTIYFESAEGSSATIATRCVRTNIAAEAPGAGLQRASQKSDQGMTVTCAQGAVKIWSLWLPYWAMSTREALER